MRRILLVVSFLLVLAAPAAARADDASSAARLTDAAAAVAGRPVQVRCESDVDWAALTTRAGTAGLAGYVLFTGDTPDDTMELAPETCAALDAFLRTPTAERCTAAPVPAGARVRALAARSRAKPLAGSTRLASTGTCAQDAKVVYAVWTLAHEAVHLSGQRDEAVADCTSLQLLEATAGRLGATPAAAHAMAAYAADWYAKVWPSAKPGYYSPECRDRGALDLNPTSTAWPS